MTTRTYEQFKEVSGPLGDYLEESTIPLDEEDRARMLGSINPVNIDCNWAIDERARYAVLAQRIHDEGSFLGDVARTPLDEMTPHDEDILLAIRETATANGVATADFDDEATWCLHCGVARLRSEVVPGDRDGVVGLVCNDDMNCWHRVTSVKRIGPVPLETA